MAFMNCSKKLIPVACAYLSDTDNQSSRQRARDLLNAWNPGGMTLWRFVKRYSGEKA